MRLTVAKGALCVRLTCVSACVPLQIERIVETFAAKGAKITLDVGVTLEVSVK